MFRKEQEMLRQIAKASDAIRRKHHMFKMGKEAAKSIFRETFKPIVTPLQKLADVTDASIRESKIEKVEKEENDSSFISAVDNDEEFDRTLLQEDNAHDAQEEYEKLTNKFLKLLNKNRKQYLDMIYGVRKLPDGSLMIGNTPISFKGLHIKIGGQKDNLKTTGLLELLFKQKPDETFISPSDLDNYKGILILTNAHKKNYSPTQPIQSSNTLKYTNIISKLFKNLSPSKRGGGLLKKNKKKTDALPQFMVAQRNSIFDYVYWDDPNELVDRLRLLISSQAAGNLNHNNEIMSIIEELREAGIIY